MKNSCQTIKKKTVKTFEQQQCMLVVALVSAKLIINAYHKFPCCTNKTFRITPTTRIVFTVPFTRK